MAPAVKICSTVYQQACHAIQEKMDSLTYVQLPSMSDHSGAGHPPITLKPPSPNFKGAQQPTQDQLTNDGAFVPNFMSYTRHCHELMI